jgi:hypothetical protein
MKRTLLRVLAAVIIFAPIAWPQDDAADDSARGVARVSLINGDVSVRRGDSGDWVAAAVNAPMVVYDHLLTGPTARAEIQFDNAHFLRLGSDTEVRLAELDSNHYQVELSRGTVTLSVIQDSQAGMEVNTPNVSVRPDGQGMYRISVTDEGESQVTVRAGNAEAATPGGSEQVAAGQTMLVRGSAEDAEFQLVAALRTDNWDRWNEDRDRQLESTQSYKYVSPTIYGAEDLDSYGRWVYVAPYGWVWSPNGVGPDWAPYRDGRWSWLDWYGWTWIDYEPWGWAPYHYGRWFYQGGYGWCWFPGGFHARHYWRPALVAFFGYGGFGVGFGNVGWVPLAPYEPYHRWYGRGYYGYRNVNNINVVSNTNIVNMYRNARVANGVTGLDAGGFARGGRGAMIHATDVALQRAALVRGPVPVAPSGESLRLGNRDAVVTSTRAMQTTRFYSPRQAPAVQRIPFNAQRQGAEQYVQRAVTARPAAPALANPGWRRMGERPAVEAPARGGWRGGASDARPADNTGWRSYGDRSQPPAERQQYNAPRYQAPARDSRTESAPRYQAPRNESVRINAPIVRQRSTPQMRSGGGSSGGSSGARMSGGGGGGARPSGGGGRSGGGGGGGRSGGGGGRGHGR